MIFLSKAVESRPTQGREGSWRQISLDIVLAPGKPTRVDKAQRSPLHRKSALLVPGRSLAFWGSTGFFLLSGCLCGHLKMNPVVFHNLVDGGGSELSSLFFSSAFLSWRVPWVGLVPWAGPGPRVGPVPCVEPVCVEPVPCIEPVPCVGPGPWGGPGREEDRGREEDWGHE